VRKTRLDAIDGSVFDESASLEVQEALGLELLFPVRVVTAGTVGTDLVCQIELTEFGFDLLPSGVLGASRVAALAVGMDRMIGGVETTQRRTAAVASGAVAMARMVVIVVDMLGSLCLVLLLVVKLFRQCSGRCPWSCCPSSRHWQGRGSIERRSRRSAVGVGLGGSTR
jgi:hypothetical protein